MTGTERRVWYRLRKRQVAGHKFRRQVPVGEYYVDFLCIGAQLAVEIDGPFHDEERDRRKTAYLESRGFRVMRFSVSDTDHGLDDVIAAIFLRLETPP